MEERIALDTDDVNAKAEMIAKLDAVKEWLDATYQDMRSRFDQRSERWQEGDTGQTASEWIDEFDSIAGEVETLSDRLTQLADKP